LEQQIIGLKPSKANRLEPLLRAQTLTVSFKTPLLYRLERFQQNCSRKPSGCVRGETATPGRDLKVATTISMKPL